jgi:hypothetical protein
VVWRALGFFILFILAVERPAYGRRGRAGSRLGDPLADDVIATIVLVRPGVLPPSLFEHPAAELLYLWTIRHSSARIAGNLIT